MKKVAFHNLGCKVNSYELDGISQMFQKRGYEIVDFAQMAESSDNRKNIFPRKYGRSTFNQKRNRNS